MDPSIVNKICRICMTSEKNVFLPISAKFSDKSIGLALEFCCGIEVAEDDDMPQNICEFCFKELIQAFFFVKRVKASDEILGRLFKCKTTVSLTRMECDDDQEEDDDEKEPLISIIPLETLLETNDKSEDENLQMQLQLNAQEMPEGYDPLHIIRHTGEPEPDSKLETPNHNENTTPVIIKTEAVENGLDNQLNDEKQEFTGFTPSSPFDDSRNDYDMAMDSDHYEDVMLHELSILKTETDDSQLEAHIKEIKINGEVVCCSYKCHKMFENEEQLIDHINDKHKSKLVKKSDKVCKKCYGTFSKTENYRRHLKEAKNETSVLECDVCFMRFWGSKRTNMITHIKGNHYENGKFKQKPPAKPKLCDDENINSQILEVPIDGVFCCAPKCFVTFPDEDKRNEHVEIEHSHKKKNRDKPQDQKCKVCLTIFKHKEYYKRHVRDMSNQKKLLQCRICGARSLPSNRTSFRIHIKNHFDDNGELKPLPKPMNYTYSLEELKNMYGFICCGQGCQMTFENEKDLLKHAHTEHKNTKILNQDRVSERPYECAICFKRFEKMRNLKDHQKKKYIDCHRSIACDQCGQKVNRSQLSSHMDKHIGENQFFCDICGKGFINKIRIAAHVKIHMKVGDYKCKLCNQRFKRATYLKNHTFKHTGIYLFSCKLCSYKAMNRFDLREHQRVHTGRLI